MKRSLISIAVAALSFSGAFGLKMADAAAAEDKKVKFADKEYDLDTGLVVITFGNGKSVEFDSNKVSEELRKQLMLHGASQKIGDSYAGAKGNYAEAIQSAEDTVEQLYAGVWKAARGEGDAKPRLAELAEAIARIKNVPLEAATAAVEKGSDDQRKQWRGNAKVKSVIATIRAEKAAKALEEAGESELQIEV